MAVTGKLPAPPNEWKTERVVPGNRWIIRNGEKVLQYYFAVRSYRHVIHVTQCVGEVGEWRDVPVEAE